MAETQELDFPGDKLTGRTNEAVVGKRLLALKDAAGSDGLRVVGYPTAGAVAHYLARHDAASGATVSMVRKGCFTVTAGAAITAPTALKATAAGKVIPWTTGTVIVGYATTDAAADGDDVAVDLVLPGTYAV